MAKRTLGSVARKGSPIAVTSNPMSAALANLRLQQPRRGANGAVTRGDARKLSTPGYAGMDPTQVKKELTDDFGRALKGSVNKQMVTATAVRDETVAKVGAGRQQLKAGAKTIGDVASIFKRGEQAQAAAAALAKARAVQEATGASDSQTAAFAQQLMMAKMQHHWDMQEAQAATVGAQDAAGEQAQFAATSLATQAPTTASIVANSYRDVMELATSEGKSPAMGDFMASFTEKTLLGPESSEYALAMQMFTRMQANPDAGIASAFKGAMTASFGAYDPKGKWLPQAIDASMKNFQATTSEAYAQWLEDHPESAWQEDKPGGVPAPSSPSEAFGGFTPPPGSMTATLGGGYSGR
jgi:hypothetical protein